MSIIANDDKLFEALIMGRSFGHCCTHACMHLHDMRLYVLAMRMQRSAGKDLVAQVCDLHQCVLKRDAPAQLRDGDAWLDALTGAGHSCTQHIDTLCWGSRRELYGSRSSSKGQTTTVPALHMQARDTGHTQSCTTAKATLSSSCSCMQRSRSCVTRQHQQYATSSQKRS